MIHELVQERRFSHFFRSQQPGKLPVIHELVRERRFRPVFEAGNQSNSLKQCIPAADYPRRKTRFRCGSLWFKCRGSLSWFMSWFKCRGSLSWFMSWFTVMVHCHGSWWFVVVCGGSWWFFSKILKKISCDQLFNQSESKIQYQISF